jgi:hypothetical protein
VLPECRRAQITREEHEDARQVAREIAKTDQYAVSMRLRKKVEMLFAHLKRILGLGRLRLRGPKGAKDEFLLAATAQNLRKLAKIFPAPQQMRNARQKRRLPPNQRASFCGGNTEFFHRMGGKWTFATFAKKLKTETRSGSSLQEALRFAMRANGRKS